MREFAKKLATFGVCSLGLGVGFGAGLGFVGSNASFSTPVQAQASVAKSTDEQNVIRVVKSVSPAVVLIQTETGLGTGVVIDGKQGLILTNAHVVGRSTRVGVRFKSTTELTGRVLGAFREIDIAVVKVSSPKPLPAAPLGDSDRLEVGQTTIAIGNPLGLEQTVTTGIVSATNTAVLRADSARGSGWRFPLKWRRATPRRLSREPMCAGRISEFNMLA